VDKKPLIMVSLCAVVLLVLASLGNVVGYQSVKSTVNDSPLFETRTQRATNQQQNTLTSQYIGMGRGTFLQFSIRDSQIEQLKKAIEIVSKMDDTTFARLTDLCIQRVRQDDSLKDTNPNEIKQMLQTLRTKPEIILNSFSNRNEPGTISFITVCPWFPGCILLNYIVAFVIMSLFLGEVIITVILKCFPDYPTERMKNLRI
jgi:hypothetical protein